MGVNNLASKSQVARIGENMRDVAVVTEGDKVLGPNFHWNCSVNGFDSSDTLRIDRNG